ncbi:DcaP family trimeric outer membrane transporter [Halioglobus sp. HI00S01]|uniref:DcaP family trimeric outer membrane transporter n=1 Tax=Halioglobus sp. HI00S01 TaxID=1822214 RepID=UPI0018D3602B|nr:DcaP family trimeric outer membrane transporter [Halioglobus sp. HI00S01]
MSKHLSNTNSSINLGLRILAAASLAACLNSNSHASSDEIAAIRQELQRLVEQNQAMTVRINQLEDLVKSQDGPLVEETIVAKNTAAPVLKKETPSGWFNIPGTDSLLTIDGFVKADLIHDLGPKSGDRTNYPNLDLDVSGADSSTGHTRLHAKQSRVILKTQTPSVYGKLLTHIEGDFFDGTEAGAGSEVISNSSKFRIRQAYGTLGGWLMGQAWSNYVDVQSFPENLDFSNDTGQAFLRQGQIRYTHDFARYLLSLSAENPESDYVDEYGKKRENNKDSLPDLTVRLKYIGDWGHISTQAALRKLGVDDGNYSDSALGYAFGVSGRINTIGKDLLRFHVSAGDGVGRYIQEGANSAAIVTGAGTSSVSMETQTAWGGYIGYQHWWSDRFRSNFNMGYLNIDWDNDLFAPSALSINERFKSMHINTIWRPVPDVDIGLEYSRAERRQIDGQEGNMERLQFSGVYRY